MDHARDLLFRALLGRSKVYSLIGKGDEALSDCRTGLARARKSGLKKRVADCLAQMSVLYNATSLSDRLLQARIYNAKGMEHRAKSMFKEAISIFDKLKQPYDLARAYYYRAEGRGLRAERQEYLEKAKDIFKKLGAKGWLQKVALTLAGKPGIIRCK